VLCNLTVLVIKWFGLITLKVEMKYCLIITTSVVYCIECCLTQTSSSIITCITRLTTVFARNGSEHDGNWMSYNRAGPVIAASWGGELGIYIGIVVCLFSSRRDRLIKRSDDVASYFSLYHFVAHHTNTFHLISEWINDWLIVMYWKNHHLRLISPILLGNEIKKVNKPTITSLK